MLCLFLVPPLGAQTWPGATVLFSQSDTHFVDAGSDAEKQDGSEVYPWKSIQDAVDRAEPGDRVHVRAGTYAPFRIFVSGREGRPITIAAAPGEEHRAIIDGTGTSVRGLIVAQGQSHIRIEGFRIQNAPVDGIFIEGSEQGARDIVIAGNVVDTTGNAGIYVCGLIMGQTIGVDEYRLFDVTIAGNEVTRTNEPNGGNEAISLGGGVSGFVIRDNWVHDSKQYGIDAKFGAIHGEIVDNVVERIEKHGIYLDTNSRTIAHIRVHGNTVRQNTNGIVLAREAEREPLVPKMYDIEISGNSVEDNAKFGIMAYRHVWDPGTGLWDDIRIVGNRVVRNREHGIHLRGMADYATGFVIEGNTLEANGRAIINEIGAEELSNTLK